VIKLIGDVAAFLAMIPAVLFVILYHLRSQWENTQIGRQTMALRAVLATILLLICLRAVFGDSDWYRILRVMAFVSIILPLWWGLALLIQAQAGYGGERNQEEERMTPEDIVTDPEDRPDVEALCGEVVDDSDIFPTETQEG
jgi:uncharacterized membrane protein